jgi:hypothetical protein
VYCDHVQLTHWDDFSHSKRSASLQSSDGEEGVHPETPVRSSRRVKRVKVEKSVREVSESA